MYIAMYLRIKFLISIIQHSFSYNVAMVILTGYGKACVQSCTVNNYMYVHIAMFILEHVTCSYSDDA